MRLEIIQAYLMFKKFLQKFQDYPFKKEIMAGVELG